MILGPDGQPAESKSVPAEEVRTSRSGSLPAPSVPETFKKDLDSWSQAMTGMAGNYRPYWLADLGLWSIQEKLNTKWWTIILIYETEVVEEDDVKTPRRVFRELDRRAIEDLAVSCLMRKYSTGDTERDWVKHKRERDEAHRLVKDQRSKTTSDAIRAIAEDASPLFKRIEAEFRNGHSHGVKQFFQVPR